MPLADGGDTDAADGADADGAGAPDDDIQGRIAEGDWLVWLQLSGDRHLIAGGVLALIFGSIVAIGVLAPSRPFVLLTDGDPVETLFQALVTATITGVTLVLTISQLVLSQELGAVGDQRERMDGAMSFRREAEDVLEGVSPAEPSAFLHDLVVATRERAADFGDAVADGDAVDDELRASVGAYVGEVTGNADAVADRLEGSTFGEFDVLRAALDYNYSLKIHEGRRIQVERGDALPSAAADALDDLLDALVLFGPAREHVKTLYFQWELSDLSRAILYTAVPALVVAICALTFLEPSTLTGSTAGVSDALWWLSIAVTISLAPFAVLLSYVLRIVTVTKRTLSIGPFVLRETERSTDTGESEEA